MRFSLSITLICLTAGCGGGTDAATVAQLMTSAQERIGPPITNSVDMVLVPIPAGEFERGAPPAAKKGQDHFQSARPQHHVTISNPFYMSATEVTQQQFTSVMDEQPWSDKPLVVEGDDYAASYISWEAAAEFCQRLSDEEGVTYRLPTEAEWEYACRAGTKSAFSFGDEGELLPDHAWFDQNAYQDDEQYPHRVAQLLPNPWGLYDMHGNVWEWCQDWYGPYGDPDSKRKQGRKKDEQPAPPTPQTDPQGPEQGWVRVWRGGGFSDNGINLLSSSRLSFGRVDYRPEYMCGFRVVREIE